jgi:hypothetical protein
VTRERQRSASILAIACGRQIRLPNSVLIGKFSSANFTTNTSPGTRCSLSLSPTLARSLLAHPLSLSSSLLKPPILFPFQKHAARACSGSAEGCVLGARACISEMIDGVFRQMPQEEVNEATACHRLRVLQSATNMLLVGEDMGQAPNCLSKVCVCVCVCVCVRARARACTCEEAQDKDPCLRAKVPGCVITSDPTDVAGFGRKQHPGPKAAAGGQGGADVELSLSLRRRVVNARHVDPRGLVERLVTNRAGRVLDSHRCLWITSGFR